MGDIPTEEILAEPDVEELSFITKVENFFMQTHYLIASNGWYVIGAAVVGYYIWKRFGTNLTVCGSLYNNTATGNVSDGQSPTDLADWQNKEEARLKAVQRLQEKYSEDAAVAAEKKKQKDEEKRKARLAELEQLDAKGGQMLGESSKKPFKPEYNPLMGDLGSSGRVCFRRPGGGGG